MTAQEVLQAISAAGLSIRTEEGKLFVKPMAKIPQHLMAAIAQHKDALIALLTAPVPESPMVMPKPPIVYWQMSNGIVLHSLPLTPESNFTSSAMYRRNCRPWIPLGATGWRTNPEQPWQGLADLPREWGLRHVGKVEVVDEEEE